jgi:hypothetical protein
MAITEKNFLGSIKIRPNTEYTYPFYIPANSSNTVDDGYIPYGKTITSATVSAQTEDGTSITTVLISGTPTVANNTVYIKFVYPGDEYIGVRCEITIDFELDNGETDQIGFTNIFVEAS